MYFRAPISRRIRRRHALGCLIVIAILVVAVATLKLATGHLPHILFMFALVLALCAAFVGAGTLITPQRAVRISPRGVWIASTRPWRARHYRHAEIDRVCLGPVAIEVDGASVYLGVGLDRQTLTAMRSCLKDVLRDNFDFGALTPQSRRLAAAKKRWTPAWAIDRASLIGVGLLFFLPILTPPMLATIGVMQKPIQITGALVSFAVVASILWLICRREMRSRWMNRNVNSSCQNRT